MSDQAIIADTFFSRMVGLLKHESLKEGEALIITQCNSIHMFFMKFSIDVIFVDKKDCVVSFIKAIKPFQLSPIFFKASYAIELPVGSIDKNRVNKGDQLKILSRKG